MSEQMETKPTPRRKGVEAKDTEIYVETPVHIHEHLGHSWLVEHGYLSVYNGDKKLVATYAPGRWWSVTHTDLYEPEETNVDDKESD
jgi:hypothetical protein